MKKKEFFPLYVFLPPWHHYCIITDSDTRILFGSLWGLGVMHPGPIGEEKKQLIGAQGTGALTDEGPCCGWALRNVRGFCDETHRALGIV